MVRKLCSIATSQVIKRAPIQLHAVHTPALRQHVNGKQPPVIFLHGLLASEMTYRSVHRHEDFAPYHDKIGIDLCNHGKSPQVKGEEMTYETMSEDVIHLLDKHEIEKAILIGHSMGGKVAMATSLHHSERISKLIVVDILPIAYKPIDNPSDTMKILRAMNLINLNEIQSRNDADQILTDHGIVVESIRQFLLTNLIYDRESQTYEWKANISEILNAMPSLLSFPSSSNLTYNNDTCLIRGEKSHFVPFNQIKQFVQLFPKTKLITFKDGGHWLPSQMPDQFIKSVNDFI